MYVIFLRFGCFDAIRLNQLQFSVPRWQLGSLRYVWQLLLIEKSPNYKKLTSTETYEKINIDLDLLEF
jgi:hypothetical protein